MQELYVSLAFASVIGGIFFVSLFELVITIRRRHIHEELEAQIKDLKAHYNSQINDLVLRSDSEVIEAEEKAEDLSEHGQEEKEAIASDYKKRIEQLEAKSRKALEAAQAKAKQLESEAKDQAAAYAKLRQDEVEQELMNLVIAVTKKVLPKSLTYDAQKKLVMEALADVKTEKESVV